MKLKRRFYDSSINFKEIPVERLVIVLIIGLASAFAIYGFFYVVRESFRVMTFGLANFPNIITELDRSYYNLFFAGLSVVFANSITVSLLISLSSNAISRRNPLRRRIINDQIFLNFNFSYWFTKMTLCFFVFSMCCMDFNFSPYVGPLSILLLTILYLESWKGLSMVFKKNRFKVQFLHLIILVSVSFGLSKLDFINYKKIDDLAIKSSQKYDLPHADFYSELSNRTNREINFEVQLFNNELRISVLNKWVKIDDIPAIIFAKRASVREELMPYLAVRISANKDLDLKFIKMIEAKLYSVNQHYIIYDIYNDDLLTSRFESRGIRKKIINVVYEFEANKNYPVPPRIPINSGEFFKDSIRVTLDKQIKINDKLISNDDLIKQFKKYINTETVFLYFFNSETKYQDYITVLSSHFIAVNQLREQQQTIFVENYYDQDDVYLKEQRRLKEKFPVLIFDKSVSKEESIISTSP